VKEAEHDIFAFFMFLLAIALVGLLIEHASGTSSVALGGARAVAGLITAAEGGNPAAAFGG
jgi:hypothetical protein